MPSLPPNPYFQTAGRVRRFVVLLGEPGLAPTVEDETDAFDVVSITKSSGGDKKDTCVLAVDLARMGRRLVDMNTPEGYSRKVEIRLADDRGQVTDDVIFWGELGVQNITIFGGNGGREEAGMVATVEGWHFGDILTGPLVYDPIDDESRVLGRPVVFNPEIDGIIEGNRGPLDPAEVDPKHHVWVDPESLRTDEAATVQSVEVDPDTSDPIPLEAEAWTLGQATAALCWLLNPDEDNVLNPELSDLDNTGLAVDGGGVYGDADNAATGIMLDAPELKNVKMPLGQYLPRLLSELLHPHGFDWCVEPVRHRDPEAAEPEAGEEDDPANFSTKLKLRFFKRSEGVERQVYLARPGSRVDSTPNNAAGVGIEWNLMDLSNEVIAQGSTVERECTFELRRAWPVADDALEEDDLRKSDETGETQYKEKPDVWRKWVLDTDGSYVGLRAVDEVSPWLGSLEAPFDLKPILGDETIPRRRKFGAPLTYRNADKERWTASAKVEWLDIDDTTDGEDGTWKHASGFSILEKECGVYFDGDKPPDDLIKLGDDARLRITATIKGDTRVEGTATRRSTSPLAADVKLYIDVSDRFHDRQIQTTGDYASVLYPGTYDADDRDDATEIQTYAEELRNVEESARISANLTLAGIQDGYKLGDLITEINGRGISLNQNSPSNATKRYLQVTEIQYDQKSQTTQLAIETFDDVSAKKMVV